jgi:hypothetical protein
VNLGRLADLHHEMGRYDEAEREFREAMAIHRETGNLRFEGAQLQSVAQLMNAMARPADAEAALRASIAALAAVSEQVEMGRSQALLAAHLRATRADDPAALAEAAALERAAGG